MINRRLLGIELKGKESFHRKPRQSFYIRMRFNKGLINNSRKRSRGTVSNFQTASTTKSFINKRIYERQLFKLYLSKPRQSYNNQGSRYFPRIKPFQKRLIGRNSMRNKRVYSQERKRNFGNEIHRHRVLLMVPVILEYHGRVKRTSNVKTRDAYQDIFRKQKQIPFLKSPPKSSENTLLIELEKFKKELFKLLDNHYLENEEQTIHKLRNLSERKKDKGYLELLK